MSVKSFAEAVKEGATRYTRGFGIEQAEAEEAEFAAVGSDGTVGGPGGTALSPAVVTDSAASPKDIDSTGVANTNVLAYDSTSGKYKPAAAGGGGGLTKAEVEAIAKAEAKVEKERAETAEALKAPLASPTLTGVPAAPTAAANTNTTQIATTAHVHAAKGEAEVASDKSGAAATAQAAAEAASRPKGTKIKTRTAHAWVIPPAAVAETLPGPVMAPVAGEELLAVRIDYRIRAGTKVTFKLQKGGIDITGFTALEAKTEAKHASPAAVALAEGEEITLVITAVEGTPTGFSATLNIEHIAS